MPPRAKPVGQPPIASGIERRPAPPVYRPTSPATQRKPAAGPVVHHPPVYRPFAGVQLHPAGRIVPHPPAPYRPPAPPRSAWTAPRTVQRMEEERKAPAVEVEDDSDDLYYCNGALIEKGVILEMRRLIQAYDDAATEGADERDIEELNIALGKLEKYFFSLDRPTQRTLDFKYVEGAPTFGEALRQAKQGKECNNQIAGRMRKALSGFRPYNPLTDV